MGKYTCFFQEKISTIMYEEDYIEEIKNTIGHFRTFSEAMDSFLMDHGYNNDIDDIQEKIRFITDKFKTENVPVPRNVKKWYTDNVRIKRESDVPFQFGFAFNLSVDEVNDFLRRICLSRGFDCHSINEIVYYFSLKNGLSYMEAKDIIDNVNKVSGEKIVDEELIYTDLLVERIEEIDTKEELIKYLNDNASLFAYNNATAFELINVLWQDIVGNDKKEGIAIREKKLLYKSFDMDEETKEEMTALRGRKDRKRDDESQMEIYLQILGLAGNYASEIYKTRSLKAILKDNDLLHPIAEDSFPDREGLNKIINGEHISFERVRKLIVLLVFYKFYANRALKNQNYIVESDDAERCLDIINDNLISANYPELYPGNPYDFIIMMAIKSNQPLLTLRDYMQELYFEKINIDDLYAGQK